MAKMSSFLKMLLSELQRREAKISRKYIGDNEVSGKSRVKIYKETTLVVSKEHETHFSDKIIKEE